MIMSVLKWEGNWVNSTYNQAWKMEYIHFFFFLVPLKYSSKIRAKKQIHKKSRHNQEGQKDGEGGRDIWQMSTKYSEASKWVNGNQYSWLGTVPN